MDTARLNITLPKEVVQILSGVKNKSAYIAEAIKEKKRSEEKKKMKMQLEAAYKQSAKEDYESYKDWEDTLKDGIDE